jgi:hypothetical protein
VSENESFGLVSSTNEDDDIDDDDEEMITSIPAPTEKPSAADQLLESSSKVNKIGTSTGNCCQLISFDTGSPSESLKKQHFTGPGPKPKFL